MISGEAPPLIGGVGDYTIRLLQSIHALRPEWSLRLMTRRPRWFDLPYKNIDGISTLRPVHGWTPKWNRLAIGLANYLKYDLIHVQEEAFSWFESDIAAKLAELKPEIPVVVTLHELHQERESLAHTKRLIDRANVLTANDYRTADRCQRFGSRQVERILFSPCNLEPLLETGRPPKVPDRVCTFGLINPLKRFDVLFEGLKLVRAKRPELTWHIIGPFEPDRNPEHRAVADQLAGADWVKFTGALDARGSVQKALHESEAMLLPFDDGASLRRTSLQAGWRFGLPVITTKPPDNEPGFEDFGNVVFADLDKPASWFDAVIAVLGSSSVCERMGRAGFDASERYSFTALAKEHIAIYERLTEPQ
jgi:glycosyltransferase involved in cell wall biosynthesis